MASKEATVYIVDCGSTMGEIASGRTQSNLDWALEYVWDCMTTTVATGRKTTLIGVVGLRTDGTSHDIKDDDSYDHLSVFQPIDQLLMPHLRRLRDQLVVSSNSQGDAISALALAVGMISEKCKKLQYTRKIVLVTDGRAPMNVDNLDAIKDKMNADGMQLLVLGADFDDSEYGVKEEDKNPTKSENESILKTLCTDLDNGTFGTLEQAVDEMREPRVKAVRPTPLYKGMLTLGNPDQYETALSIGVERYPKVMQAKAQAASKYVLRGDMSASQPTQSSGTLSKGDSIGKDGLAAVKAARVYQVEDEDAPGGKKDVEMDELSKGYEYGRTAVHIEEADRNVTMYETTEGLEIIGFVAKDKYERFLEMGRSALTVAKRHDEKNTMALSSLIHALYELESYAVARLVRKTNAEPRIVLLAPNIEPDFECLYDVELPFAEDIRSYRFPPLDRVVTVSGKVLTVHRNLPSGALRDAMDAYVDSMDLSTLGKDDEGGETEYAPLDETYSPMLHRINQVIKHRAVYPQADPPKIYDVLTRYSKPPDELVRAAHKPLQAVIEAGEVKRVPPKARGKRYGKKGREDKPLSELDIGALLAADPERKSSRIDPNNAIPMFKQIMQDLDQEEIFEDAVKQLGRIICDYIRQSTGSSKYGEAVAAISVMREELLAHERPAKYNDFMKKLKSKMKAEELGGPRWDMWHEIRSARLGLIQEKEDPSSSVDEDEARTFMRWS